MMIYCFTFIISEANKKIERNLGSKIVGQKIIQGQKKLLEE